MPQPNPIAALAEDLAQLCCDVVVGGREIARASVDRWFRARGEAELMTLSNVRFGWRVYFQRQQTQTLFWFIPLGSDVVVPLDARVYASAVPTRVPSMLVEPPMRVELPAFLWLNPSPLDVRRFAPAGATPDNTLLLRLGADGEDILGVLLDREDNPDPRNARLVYSPGGVPGTELPIGDQFTIAPFLALIDTLAAWQAAGMPSHPQSGDDLPPGSSKPVAEVLNRLRDAYSECRRQLNDPAMSSPNPMLSSNWDLREFGAEVALRLNAAGELIENSADERFLVALKLAVGDRATPGLRVTAGPADLVASAPLIDAVLGALSGPFGLEKLTDAMADGQALPNVPKKFQRELVRTFLASVVPGEAKLIRLGRRKAYVDVMLSLSGVLVEKATTLLAFAAFKIDESKSPPTAVLSARDDLNVVVSPPQELAQATVSGNIAEPFLGLLARLRSWRRLVF